VKRAISKTIIHKLIGKLKRIYTFSAFRYRSFLLLFLSALAVAAADFMLMVALGWMVLEMTQSALSIGMVWATRSAPHLIWGLLAGTIADRLDRRKLLFGALIAKAGLSVLMGILVSGGRAELWHVLVFTFLTSSISTFVITANQALIVDIVGPEEAMGAISLSAVAKRSMGVVGSAAAGILIAALELFWIFHVIAGSLAIGCAVVSLIRLLPDRNQAEPQSVAKSFVEGLKVIRENNVVFTLVLMAVLCEILGFSYQTLLPVFARDLLDAGVSGLGTMTALRSVGAVIAVLALVSLGNFRAKGRLILGIFLGFGISLVLLAQSRWYGLSLLFCISIGAMAAAFDSMQHTMLQLSVADHQRGRAMGIWLLSIGFGPLGSLATGALADLIGPRFALSLNGGLMIVAFALIRWKAEKIRNA
jgi:MFS family permease